MGTSGAKDWIRSLKVLMWIAEVWKKVIAFGIMYV
jgi:hypothetical protein